MHEEKTWNKKEGRKRKPKVGEFLCQKLSHQSESLAALVLSVETTLTLLRFFNFLASRFDFFFSFFRGGIEHKIDSRLVRLVGNFLTGVFSFTFSPFPQLPNSCCCCWKPHRERPKMHKWSKIQGQNKKDWAVNPGFAGGEHWSPSSNCQAFSSFILGPWFCIGQPTKGKLEFPSVFPWRDFSVSGWYIPPNTFSFNLSHLKVFEQSRFFLKKSKKSLTVSEKRSRSSKTLLDDLDVMSGHQVPIRYWKFSHSLEYSFLRSHIWNISGVINYFNANCSFSLILIELW